MSRTAHLPRGHPGSALSAERQLAREVNAARLRSRDVHTFLVWTQASLALVLAGAGWFSPFAALAWLVLCVTSVVVVCRGYASRPLRSMLLLALSWTGFTATLIGGGAPSLCFPVLVACVTTAAVWGVLPRTWRIDHLQDAWPNLWFWAGRHVRRAPRNPRIRRPRARVVRTWAGRSREAQAARDRDGR